MNKLFQNYRRTHIKIATLIWNDIYFLIFHVPYTCTNRRCIFIEFSNLALPCWKFLMSVLLSKSMRSIIDIQKVNILVGNTTKLPVKRQWKSFDIAKEEKREHAENSSMGNFIESVMHARLIHHSSFRSSEVGMVHTATKSILVLCAGGEKGKKYFLEAHCTMDAIWHWYQTWWS